MREGAKKSKNSVWSLVKFTEMTRGGSLFADALSVFRIQIPDLGHHDLNAPVLRVSHPPYGMLSPHGSLSF